MFSALYFKESHQPLVERLPEIDMIVKLPARSHKGFADKKILTAHLDSALPKIQKKGYITPMS